MVLLEQTLHLRKESARSRALGLGLKRLSVEKEFYVLGESFGGHDKDGHDISLEQQARMLFGVISGRRSAALDRRATELDFVEIHQGVHDKLG